MFGHLFNLMKVALKGAPMSVLRTIAGKLSTLTRTTVQPAVASIVSASRTFVGNNKTKLLFVLNVLATAGIMIDWDSEETKRLPENTQLQLSNFRETVMASIEANTGDGHANTVIGVDDPSLYVSHVTRAKEARKVLDKAVAAAGSYNAFVALREAMFMEEEDILAARSI